MDFALDYVKNSLKEQLKNETLQVTFTKKDGTQRAMRCTLNSSVIPAIEEKTSTRSVPTTSLAVFDVEIKEWRSFRWDSIINVQTA